MTARTSFGQWLKQRRKTLDLTREDLAGRLGCAAVTLTKIEGDERRPSKQLAELLAQHLNIPAEDLPAFVRFARAEAAEDTAPWGTPFHPPSNLLPSPTLLIGRDAEAAALCRRLLQPQVRLLTLTGPPGIGKTRLALQVAAKTRDDFADGVFFIPLAPITDASLVLTTIAAILDVPDAGPHTPLERLQAFLRDKQLLLVLDNFEQILAAAPSIAELLVVCPWLKLLVTSRAPLRIRQERQSPVSPLSVPDLGALPDVESVAGYSAVTLFVERAQAVKPDFVLSEDNAPTVAALCARLDGLPLAIELISARIKLLPPAALLDRLSGRLMLQSDGLRDIEPRHRTLNAAIDWSYQLLSADEQILFRRLGVFVGGWMLDTARAVCLENLNLSVLDGLASLLDKNLVKQADQPDGEPRFLMLETIREYALEQLATRHEAVLLQQRHALYFLNVAQAVPRALVGVEQGLWWDRLEVEHANFRAALAWSQTEAGGDTGLHLAVALTAFWERRGHLSEGSGWLADALGRYEARSPSPTKADRKLQAKALEWQGKISLWQGYFDAAQQPLEESLILFRELEDHTGLADVLGKYGMMFVLRGDYERAAPTLEESLVLSRELDNPSGIALCLLFLGNLAYSQGNGERARMFWEESLSGFRAVNQTWDIATLLASLAMVALDQGDYQQAGVYLAESLTRLRKVGERWQTAFALEGYGRLFAEQEQASEDVLARRLWSARVFGAAEIFRETLHAPIFSFQLHSRDRGLTALHAQLDEAALAAAWAEGRAMTLNQIVAYALEETYTPNEMAAAEQNGDSYAVPKA